MAFTIPEALADLPAALALVNKINDSIKALPAPPAPRKAADYAAIVCACAPDLAALIDTIEEQSKS